MESDIEFGPLDEVQPGLQTRPDRNRHYAVVTIGSPQADDLAIFVDMDVLRDVEQHACSDVRVELGGVLLGGQFEDDEGQPFVVIADSLRAQHYEATKGSFKFTHATWEQITRERAHFPRELQVVGWYHTHPGWGVFLSGMDAFICDHFFRRPLDVALVVDPCRPDRSFFHWSRGPARCVQRTRGFHIIASRFRRQELQEYAAVLEGKCAMSADPRIQGSTQPPCPAIALADPRNGWYHFALLSLLAMQFCFLALVAWRMVPPPTAPSGDATLQQLAAIEQSLGSMATAVRREAETQARIELLDQLLAQGKTAPGLQADLARSLAEKTSENKELRAALRAHQALEEELDARVAALQSELSAARQEREQLSGELRQLQAWVSKLREENASQRGSIAALEEKLTGRQRAAQSRGDSSADARSWQETWPIIAAACAGLVAGGLLAALACRTWQTAPSENSPEEPAPPTSNR